MIKYSYTLGVAKYSIVMSESDRQDYVNKVYRFLMGLKPGTTISVERFCKAETRLLFIEVVKMYIDERGYQDVEFNEDYSTVRKMN
jgi:hypothetical protein